MVTEKNKMNILDNISNMMNTIINLDDSLTFLEFKYW